VVHGRHLLPSPVEVPLPRLLVKAQRVMEEAEVGFRRECEKLEAERLRLSDWERCLGDRIQVVASRAVKEWAQLEREREVQREKMRRVIDREIAVISREQAAIRKEMEVELKERSARHTIDTAKAMAKAIDDKQATLNHQEQDLSHRETAVKEEEDRLSTLRAYLEERNRSLAHRLEVLKHQEAEVEGLLAEQRARTQRIAKWVGEASATLEPLGLCPIQVAEAPSSIGAILPALDSTAERLQRLESTLVACLEAEGRVLARMVVDHVLTYFRSHDPAISLAPVLEGPIPEEEAADQEEVKRRWRSWPPASSAMWSRTYRRKRPPQTAEK
jgi:hypothetical protein